MKALIYCTKAEPYLYEIDTDKGPKYLTSDIDFKDDNPKINGLIVAQCDCKEAFIIKNLGLGFGGGFKAVGINTQDAFVRSGEIPLEKMRDYAKGKDLYAYHFENIKAIDTPFPVTELYRDGTCVYPLAGAPQSWRFAYRKEETTKEDYYANVGKPAGGRYYFHEGGGFFYSDKIILISIQSPWCCKCGNGEKDLEIRKTRIQNAGIEYK